MTCIRTVSTKTGRILMIPSWIPVTLRGEAEEEEERGWDAWMGGKLAKEEGNEKKGGGWRDGI